MTIDTNRPAPSSLRDLFPGVHQGEVPNILSVKYHCRGLDCSIVLSKNAGRDAVAQTSTAVAQHEVQDGIACSPVNSLG